MERIVKIMKDVKYKQDDNIYTVNLIIGTSRIFLPENSFPDGVIPMVGDKILWNFEIDYFVVTEVQHLSFTRIQTSLECLYKFIHLYRL